MKQKHKKKPKIQREIAKERILILFNLASKMFHEDKTLSNRYVEIARKIKMKYKVSFSKELKKKICKNCHSFLVPGINCRVRLTNQKVVYFCKECNHFMRYPYINQISKKLLKKTKKPFKKS